MHRKSITCYPSLVRVRLAGLAVHPELDFLIRIVFEKDSQMREQVASVRAMIITTCGIGKIKTKNFVGRTISPSLRSRGCCFAVSKVSHPQLYSLPPQAYKGARFYVCPRPPLREVLAFPDERARARPLLQSRSVWRSLSLCPAAQKRMGLFWEGRRRCCLRCAELEFGLSTMLWPIW